MQQNLQIRVIMCPSCKSESIGLDPAKILSGAGLSCQTCGWVLGSVIPAGFSQVNSLSPSDGLPFSAALKSGKAG